MGWYWALVFLLAAGIDWLYVKWAQAATSRKAVQAMVTAAFIQIAGVLSVLLYVADPVLMVPNVVGHSLGSYLAVRYSNENARQPS